MSVTPNDATARVCAGVDWAADDHAVCVVGGEGEVLDIISRSSWHFVTGKPSTPPSRLM